MKVTILNLGRSLFIFLSILSMSFIAPNRNYAQDFKKKVKWGGRMMFDAMHYSNGEIQKSGVEIRRARFFSKGSLSSKLSYKLQFDFAGSKVSFKDAYIRCANLPYIGGEFTIGNQTDPLSIEQSTSSKYITFMERSLPTSLFPKRAMGVGYANTRLLHGRFGLQASWLYPLGSTVKAPDLNSVSRSATIKINALPIKRSDAFLLYVGLGYSDKVMDGSLGFKAHPESHLVPAFIGRSLQNVSSYGLLNSEFAWVFHSFSVQGEFMKGNYHRKDQDAVSGTSYYGTVSYFITGEHRSFKSATGGFSRVHPKHNWDPANGQWGAWELAFRYSTLDLTPLFANATVRDISAGVNVYLNPYTRLMYNFIQSKDGLSDQSFQIHQLRWQVDF